MITVSGTLNATQDNVFFETGLLRLEQLPSGVMQVYREGETQAICAFDGVSGSFNGFDHQGDSEILANYLHSRLGSGLVTLSVSGGVGVGDNTETFVAFGVSGGQAWVAVTDIDESITISVETSGDDVAWVRATGVVYTNENFPITLPVAPYIRLAVTAANSVGTPTIAVLFTGNK